MVVILPSNKSFAHRITILQCRYNAMADSVPGELWLTSTHEAGMIIQLCKLGTYDPNNSESSAMRRCNISALVKF